MEIDVDYSKSFSFAVKLDKILYFCKKRLEYEKVAKLQIPDSERTARNDLSELAEKQILKRIGETNQAKYVFA
ncbi:hypothetical protein SDC9_203948 [bioreactor metagenome]|uniref:Uncharacterized protein n=1 Tax=bioreactor metagenome TaxID=1076179 RepID=A0A645IZH0_9ZZZZ